MTTRDATAPLTAESGDSPTTHSLFSRPRVRRAALAGTAVLAAAGLATGVSLYAASTAVAVTVDGETETVRTFGSTVEEVLDDAGVEVAPRDEVLPRPSAPVSSDTEVTVRTAERLPMRVDGVERAPWVLADTAGGALEEVGIDPSGALVSALPETPISRVGTLAVSLPRPATVVVDGEQREVTSAGTTTRDVLEDAGVVVGMRDRVTPGLGDRPEPGETIEVVRVATRQATRTEEIPVDVERVEDDDLTRGTTRVVREAVTGLREVVVEELLYDGRVVAEERLSESVVREPQPGLVRVGTAAPAPARAASGGASTGGSSGLNWAALAACESGGDPNAYNPAGPYYGLYQFDRQTWQSVGGSGVPTDHSAAEQTRRAQILYNARGASPWPVCGSRL